MAKDLQRLKNIYRKTDGYCHVCHRKLSFQNHGKNGAKGAWHIEHSKPRRNGGTDHLNNLFPACVECNIQKGVETSRTARRPHGNTRAPFCKEKKQEVKDNYTARGALIGGLLGTVAGPWGMAVGATIGGYIGRESSPNR